MKFQRITAVVAALFLAATMSACSSGDSSQSGQSGQAASQSGDENRPAPSDEPKVDRSGTQTIPEVKGDFGEEPVITPSTGSEPVDTIIATTLVQGDGREVQPTDAVQVAYKGVLWDGTEFDSTFKEGGKPIAFSLDRVIVGWKAGLTGQHVGDRVELVIPWQWAYGEQGQASIPPKSTLTFVVDIHNAVDTADVDQLKSATLTDAALPDGVTVEGDLGTAPKLTLAEGTNPEPGTYLISEGTGPELTKDNYAVLRAVEAVVGVQNEGQTQMWDVPNLAPVANLAQLEGHKVGSRLMVVIDMADPRPTSDQSQSGEVQMLRDVAIFDLAGSL